MERYNPAYAPDPEKWQALDEDERIALIQRFHEQHDEDIPKEAVPLHAAIHAVVENQLAMRIGPVAATVERLTRQGLDRHEAIHAVGAILAEEMHALMSDDAQSMSQDRYHKRLGKLTAKRWMKGKW